MSTTVVSESTVPALSLKHKIYISIEKPLKTPTTSLDPHSILRRHDTQSTIDEPDSPFNANGRTGFETVDVATAEPAYYHRRPISSTNRHLRHMQRTSRAERLRDTTDDIASTNFAIVPVRPPLRPTFSFDSGLSYYSSASPDLESKSLAVAADEEAKHAGGQQAHSIRLYASIAILFVLNFTCGFEAFSFTTILPTLGHGFGSAADRVFWIANSYLLSVVLIQPLAMRLSSSIGSKPIVLLGLSLWATGALVAAMSASLGVLVVGRSVSGVGGGAVSVLLLSTFRQVTGGRATQSHERLLSSTYWLGASIGPIVGGTFAQSSRWQRLFLVPVPVCLLAFLGLLWALSRPRMDGSLLQRLRQVEYLHWILLLIALIPIVWSVSSAGTAYPWMAWHILLPLFAGVTTFGSWIISCWFTTTPILPVSILRRVPAMGASLGTLIQGMITSAIIFLMPFAFAIADSKPAITGVALLPCTVALAVGSLSTLTVATPFFRLATFTAWILASTGLGMMLLIDTSNIHTISIPFGIISGLALGSLSSTLIASLQSAATTDDETIHAAPMYTFLTSLGNSLGVAIGSCIFLNRFSIEIQQYPHRAGDGQLWASKAIEMLFVMRNLPPTNTQLKEELMNSFMYALRSLWIVLCALAAVALVVFLTCSLIEQHQMKARAREVREMSEYY